MTILLKEIWPKSTFRVLIYERKIHAKIDFFIKNNKILKFFSFSKNKSCVSKFWDFLQKLTLFLKFARVIGGGKKRGSRRRRGTFFFYPLFFCFQPNSRATKRARPQASEARPSASLRSEKVTVVKKTIIRPKIHSMKGRNFYVELAEIIKYEKTFFFIQKRCLK